MLGLGRRDPARPDGIDVDREPAPAEDIDICRGGVFAGEPYFDPVRPPGEECRIHRVQGDVDPGDRGVGVEGLDGPGKPIIIVAVARVGDAVGERPDFDHATTGGDEPYRPVDLLDHRPISKIPGLLGLLPSGQSPFAPPVLKLRSKGTSFSEMRGKRGALAASPRATRRKETSGTMKEPARVWITTARPAGFTAACPSIITSPVTVPPSRRSRSRVTGAGRPAKINALVSSGAIR